MPPIEADIRTYLAAAGTTAGGRFFYDPAPQGTQLPYGYIQVISTTKFYSHAGPGLKRSRVQISCYGDKHNPAKTLAEAVETAMESFTGCQKAFYENEVHMQNEKIRHIALDFFVWH